MLISYAQNFEDVMLWRALGHLKAGFPAGFYIDVGAQDPVVDSVSLAFYERGWRGIHVEPIPRYAEMLRLQRPDETVIQSSVGTGRQKCRFFEIPDTGLSTGDSKIAQQHRSAGFTVNEISVARTTLAAILESCGGREIHWMKIDVEGAETDVLRSWQSSEARPWIVVVESTLPLTRIEMHEEWEPLLVKRGYQFAYTDGLNRFFVSAEHRELKEAFRAGPNLFDEFALSGTSTAPFCALLKERHHTELKQKDRELEAKLAREHALAAESLELREESAQIRTALAAEKSAVAELHGRLIASQRESLRAAQHLGVREQELGAQMLKGRDEASRLTMVLAEREREHGEILAAQHREHDLRIQQEADRQAKALAEREREHREMLAAQYRDFDAQKQREANRMGALLIAREQALDVVLRTMQNELSAVAQVLSTTPEPLFEVSPIDHYRLRDLTRFDDEAFIDAAYQALLCRMPDATGLPFYLNRLRTGTDKIQILGELRYSREGRSIGAKVPGLAILYELRKASAVPILGACARFSLFLWRLPGLARYEDNLASRNAQLSNRLRSFAGNATEALESAARALATSTSQAAPDLRAGEDNRTRGPRPSVLSLSIELGAKSPSDVLKELASLLSTSQEARDLSSR